MTAFFFTPFSVYMKLRMQFSGSLLYLMKNIYFYAETVESDQKSPGNYVNCQKES